MLIDSSMVISGFISKIINEIVDVPLNPIKKAIRNADKNRKDKNQSIETKIYQVIIDALNEFTKNKFEGSDVLYDAAESIIKGFKTNRNSNLEAVRTGLNMLVSQVISDTCEDFLRTLCYEICKAENRDLAIEVIIVQQEQTKEFVQEGFSRSNLNSEEINRKLDYLIKGLFNKQENEERDNSKNPIVNRAEEYARKWDKNVFLNNFNRRDKKAGVNIKLSQLYLDEYLPHYIWGANVLESIDEEETDIQELLREYIVDNNDKKMLLILGQPGIGKSTLITWIMANLVEKKDAIYVYQFASDLKNIDWQGDNILSCIFQTLKMKYDELENKVLILDGFDEIYANSDRERILNQIYHKLKGMNYLKQFSLIITCRKNYINELKKVECDYITLQTWDGEQISRFCETYGNINKNPVSKNIIDNMLDNKEILGIPLILYMVLALNISIGENSSLVDIYDQIFSLDGGIYDRCINNLCYGEQHRISRIKKEIHQISQKIAFWMFENKPDEAFITKKKCEEICDDILNETSKESEDIKRDVLISNYFEPIKHCEGIGTDELQFVHRSIYEYFVAVYFFETLCSLTSKETIAGKLGELLKDGYLSEQILEFIKYKFNKTSESILPESIKEIFQLMLKDGMTYYIGTPIMNVIKREGNIFSNMLEMVVLWNHSIGEVDGRILVYLQSNRKNKLNLKGIKLKIVESDLEISAVESNIQKGDLEGAYLMEANLMEADLGEVNLTRANLKGANLEGAVLKRADIHKAALTRANLQKVDLSEMNLKGANLIGADLSNADLKEADLRDTDLRNAILLEADLRRTNLNEAYLSRAFLNGADLRGANINEIYLFATGLDEALLDEQQVESYQNKDDLENCKVYISETEEVVDYQEYCIHKQIE